MSACCSTFEHTADQQFNQKKAASELQRYRTKGPRRTTRLLQEGIARAGVLHGTLLDVGSGIGGLTFGLLERGISHAVAVDASSAYLGAARQEAERRGRGDAIHFVHADFVSVASQLPTTSVVALDQLSAATLRVSCFWNLRFGVLSSVWRFHTRATSGMSVSE